YVEVMWKMLQQEKPGDYVLGTGDSHTVREFLDEAFSYAGLQADDHVKIDKRYLRPTEVDELRAVSRKAERALGWNPKVRFREVVKVLVDAEMRKKGLQPIGEGDAVLDKFFPDRWWNDSGPTIPPKY